MHCSQPPFSGSGKHVPCYTGSWCSPGRHSPNGVASSYVLQRSKSSQVSMPSPSSAPSISHESVLGEAGPHTAPSAVTLHPFLQAAWLLPHLFQTSWLNPSVLLRASRWNHFSFRLPSFKGQPRTSYVTSYLAPPMMCYFCQFPHLLPSFCCPL